MVWFIGRSRLALAGFVLCCGQLSAQEVTSEACVDPPASCDSVVSPEVACDNSSVFANDCDIWCSPTLTGDWCGARSALQQNGVTFAGRVTQFGFGVSGGIDRAVAPPLSRGNTFEYTGRGEYDLIFDLEKFGGLPKGSLLVRAEHWYGEYGNVSLKTGSFAPAVFPAAIPPAPQDQGVPFITNFVVTQPLSQNLVVFAGKKDVLGGADQDIFAGGDGTDQFVNQALIANPAFLLGLPYTSFTAGVVMPQEWGALSAYVYDPRDWTTDFLPFDQLFSDGVIVGGEVKVKTNLFNKPGEQHVGGMWKHVELTDLTINEPPPSEYPEPAVAGAPTLPDSWTVYYGFDQYLVTYANQAQRGWGLFGRASLSDGNPTPVQYFLSAGIGGDSPIATRRSDKFGIGWYYVGASDEFGLIPRLVFGPRDGTGVEVFYNFQVTPWMNVTPDVQYIVPGAAAIAKDAFIYGLRVNMTL